MTTPPDCNHASGLATGLHFVSIHFGIASNVSEDPTFYRGNCLIITEYDGPNFDSRNEEEPHPGRLSLQINILGVYVCVCRCNVPGASRWSSQLSLTVIAKRAHLRDEEESCIELLAILHSRKKRRKKVDWRESLFILFSERTCGSRLIIKEK